MKYLLLAVWLCASLAGYAQKNSFLYSDVVTQDGVNKEELYSRAKSWFTRMNANSGKAIQVDNEKDGVIEGNTSFPFDGADCLRGRIYYTIKVLIKDGKYKYEVTGFTHKAYDAACSFGLITTDEEAPKIPPKVNPGTAGSAWKTMREKLGTYALSSIASLNYAMDKPVPQKQNNW